MKSPARNNLIFSKLKEDIQVILSIFDGSKYTTSEEEISLPVELRSSIENINSQAKDYEDKGMIVQKNINKSNSKQSTKLNKIKPPVRTKETIKDILKEIDDEGLEL